jgi:exosortase
MNKRFTACALFGVSIILLIAVLPYAAGYSDHRQTMLSILISRWFDHKSTTWQYGVLVPFVAGWLVWKRRQELSAATVAGSAFGLPIMVLAMFNYYVGYKANNYYFGFAGVQLFMLGAVLWLFGSAWARLLRFPWLVLGFMWPLYFLEERLGFPLRLISTNGVMLVTRALHLPIIAEGTLIYSSSAGQKIGSWMNLQIDGPCSGMNTLFALMFVGTIFSWFSQRSNVRRALLFACCIPLALIGNMVRIGLLIAGCAAFGQDFAVGNERNEMTAFHLLAGLVVFPILVLGLQSISRLMNKLWAYTGRGSRTINPRQSALDPRPVS